MKRKLNESFASAIKIDVVSLVNDYPELLGNIDKLAGQLENSCDGVVITKEEDDDTVYMVIDGISYDDLEEIFSDEYYIDDIASYIDTSDVDLDDIESDLEAKDAAESDMQDEYGDDYIDAEDWEEIPDYDDVDIDDDSMDEFTDYDYDDEDSLNDSEFDNCVESVDDEEFECYESYKTPRSRKMVSLSEALKMRKNNVSVKDIVRSAKLNESVIATAINKAKNETVSKKQQKLDMLKESLGEDKYNLVVTALKEGRKTLYTKKTINGKNMSEYKSKELLELMNTVKSQCDSLNESAVNAKAIETKKHLIELLDEELTYRLTLKKLLEKKALNESVLNEDDNADAASDDVNILEPLPVEPTGADTTDDAASTEGNNAEGAEGDGNEGSEDPESDEVVELSRVIVTVANQAAADDLKQSLVDAGVPEDAIEFEEVTDEDATDEGDADADTDEGDTEGDGNDTADNNESNESLLIKQFKHLYEDDGDAAADTEGDDVASTDDAEGDDASTDDAEGDEDKPVKVILTNTDYINDLADVLNNEYGITKEEFEEMIDGEIVDDDAEGDDSADAEGDADGDSSDDSDAEQSSNGDDAVDSMSQEELNKLFGGN